MPTPRTSHLITRAATAARITLITLVVTAFWFIAIALTNSDALKHFQEVMALYTLIVTGATTAACAALVLIKDQRDERIEALIQQISDLEKNLKNETELMEVFAAMARELDGGQLKRQFELHPDTDGSDATYQQWVEEWVRENVSSEYAHICAETLVEDQVA